MIIFLNKVGDTKPEDNDETSRGGSAEPETNKKKKKVKKEEVVEKAKKPKGQVNSLKFIYISTGSYVNSCMKITATVLITVHKIW